ncbi:hypothetical protein ASE12_11910 [Aeromicrobium sp. Root236]|nr:hypothetical protein ASE12_11910 [Aeromicrobium sp. Root236]
MLARNLSVVVSEEVFRSGDSVTQSDWDALSELGEPTSARDAHLLGLLTDDSLDRLFYAHGPMPAGVPMERVEGSDEPMADDWVTVHRRQVDSSTPRGTWASHQARWRQGQSVSFAVMVGAFENVDLAGTIWADKVFGTDASHEQREAARSDAAMIVAAQAVHASVVVTTRKFALEAPPQLLGVIQVVTPEQALPLIGLYMRSRRRYYFTKGRGVSYSLNANSFWGLNAQGLLPSVERWQRSSYLVDEKIGAETCRWLTNSVVERVARALRARDRIHLALIADADNDSADELLDNLDLLLVSLLGAFDAAAKVADLAANVHGQPHQTKWQNDQWRRRVGETFPTVEDLVGPSTRGGRVFHVQRLLRNSVHDEMISAVRLETQQPKRRENIIGLPADLRARLLDHVQHLGGPEIWGVQEIVADQLHAQPGILVEQLLAESLDLLDGLIDATTLAGKPADAVQEFDPYDLGPHFPPALLRLQLGL